MESVCMSYMLVSIMSFFNVLECPVCCGWMFSNVHRFWIYLFAAGDLRYFKVFDVRLCVCCVDRDATHRIDHKNT